MTKWESLAGYVNQSALFPHFYHNMCPALCVERQIYSPKLVKRKHFSYCSVQREQIPRKAIRYSFHLELRDAVRCTAFHISLWPVMRRGTSGGSTMETQIEVFVSCGQKRVLQCRAVHGVVGGDRKHGMLLYNGLARVKRPWAYCCPLCSVSLFLYNSNVTTPMLCVG